MKHLSVGGVVGGGWHRLRRPDPGAGALALGLLCGGLSGLGAGPSLAVPVDSPHGVERPVPALPAGPPLESAPIGLDRQDLLSPLAPSPAAAATQPSIQAGYGRLPMHFEPNQGQAAGEVRYLARGPGYSLLLTDAEAVLVLRRGADGQSAAGVDQSPDADSSNGKPVGVHTFTPNPTARHQALAGRHLYTPPPAEATEGAVVRMRLTGATHNPAPAVAGLEPQPGISNYYLGNDPARWRSGIPHYAKVQYDQVYPGIDLVFYGNPQQLEYDLVVAPGADPGQIRLSFDGVDGMRLDGEGNLVLAVAGGEIVQKAPRIYQRVDGQERPVAGRYALLDGKTAGAAAEGEVSLVGAGSAKTVGLALAAYDPDQPLVIDPVVVYSTFLGGSDIDLAERIAIDGAGSAYVIGSTASLDFPTVDARYPDYAGGNFDAFVTKLDAQGQMLVYSTYLGGSDQDGGTGITVDGAGNAYVTGETFSSDFPTVNARYPTYGGGLSDAFVTKLNAQGQGPVYSTYLGGSDEEEIWKTIAVDGAGNAYVTGRTRSTDFPMVNPRYPSYRGGSSDAFVTKFDPRGQGPVYSTYLGGSGEDMTWGIAVDALGNAYVAGETDSYDFSTLNARYPTYQGGNWDAFVTKLGPQGQGPVYSTYLGGSASDGAYGIAIDGTGNAFVTGYTGSSNFPAVNARYPNYSGNGDVFVTKLDAGGQGPVYSTYLGGSDEDVGHEIAVDGSGNAHVTGRTDSGNFPTADAPYPNYGGAQDAFVTKLDSQGQGPVYSTYLGGSGEDGAINIAIDAVGNAYVVGATASVDFPTVNALYSSYGGGESDAFVAKIGTAAEPSPLNAAVLPYARAVGIGTPATAFASIINSDSATATGCSIGLPNGIPASFTYQTTNAGNALTGTPNTPVSIAPGATQGFVFGITPTSTMTATEIPLVFDCANTAPATSYAGLNTFILSSAASAPPDLLAIGATPSGDGVVRLPSLTGTGFFATAAVNIGSTGSVTASADDGGRGLPLNLQVCETNAAGVQLVCGNHLTRTVAPNQTVFYTVFVTGTGQPIAFDPANKRLFLRFKVNGTTVGATNVAVMAP